MKILIAGAGGQLGLELQEILSNNRCREGALPTQYCNAQVIAATSAMLDITNPIVAQSIFALHKPDLVINCAAYTAVDKAESEAEHCMTVNRDSAALLAQLCSQSGAAYIYPSSESVFGGEQTVPYTEEDATSPQNVYGKSKLAGEQAVLAACPTALIPRAGWLYGFYGRNFVKTIGGLASQKENLTVVSDQYGNPTNVDTFCLRIFQLLDAGKSGVYHCVDRDVTTRYEFARTIVENLELPCTVNPCTTEEYPLPAPRSKYMGMDCGKMEGCLNIYSRTWRDVLVDYLKEAKRRGIFA